MTLLSEMLHSSHSWLCSSGLAQASVVCLKGHFFHFISFSKISIWNVCRGDGNLQFYILLADQISSITSYASMSEEIKKLKQTNTQNTVLKVRPLSTSLLSYRIIYNSVRKLVHRSEIKPSTYCL